MKNNSSPKNYVEAKKIKNIRLTVRLDDSDEERLESLRKKHALDGRLPSKAAIVVAGLKALEDAERS